MVSIDGIPFVRHHHQPENTAPSRCEALMTTLDERPSSAEVLDLDSFADAADPRYSIEVERCTDLYAVLRLAGAFEMGQRVDLIHALDRLRLAGTDVLVDLSAVTFISAGVANAVVDASLRGDNRIRLFVATRAILMVLDALGAHELIVDGAPVIADLLVA